MSELLWLKRGGILLLIRQGLVKLGVRPTPNTVDVSDSEVVFEAMYKQRSLDVEVDFARLDQQTSLTPLEGEAFLVEFPKSLGRPKISLRGD